MNASGPQWKRWLVPALKLAVVAVLAWALRETLVKGLRDLGKYSWHARPGWLALGAALYLVAMLPAALFWRQLLHSTGQHVGLLPSLRAFYISQLGKYVPGKAMVVVLRTGLVSGPGVEKTVVAAAVFAETLTTMAVGSLWALVILAVWGPRDPTLLVAAAGMSLATGLPTLPPVMKLLARVLGLGKFNPRAADKLGAVGYRVLAVGWLGISAGWLFYGLSLWATLYGLGAEPGSIWADLRLNVAVVALSVVAGFLAMLPGGLGVRELVLLKLLEPRYGNSLAVVSAIVLRLSWLVAEMVVSAILYPAGRRLDRADGDAQPAAREPATNHP